MKPYKISAAESLGVDPFATLIATFRSKVNLRSSSRWTLPAELSTDAQVVKLDTER